MSEHVSRRCQFESAVDRSTGNRRPELAPDNQPETDVAALQEAIRHSKDDWHLHHAQGEALLAAGRDEEALGLFLKAVELMPQLDSACAKIGIILLARGLNEPAALWLRRAVELDPQKLQYLPPLAVAELALGRQPQARALLDRWTAAAPDSPARRHLALAILGQQTSAKADANYLSRFFDDYATTYDQSLAKLRYRGPQLILDTLTRCVPSGKGMGDILDVGCGTGLVGQILRPFADRLVGVDLSENMLRKATERGVYDELCHLEMITFMLSRPTEFHLITAADVLTYCGDLHEFSAAAAAALWPEGWLVVVLEAWERPAGDQGYFLNRSGRYSHCLEYVQQCFSRHGFAIKTVSHSAMRTDFGRPVASLSVAAQFVRAN